MIEKNKKMNMELSNIKYQNLELNTDLKEIVEAGFVNANGFVFLKMLYEKATNVSEIDFPDRTGYECFINSVHIDDFVEADCLITACMFVDFIFKKWKDANIKGVLCAIISSEELSTIVKIHLKRNGESWLDENIEKYEDAVLVTDTESTLIENLFPV